MCNDVNLDNQLVIGKCVFILLKKKKKKKVEWLINVSKVTPKMNKLL